MDDATTFTALGRYRLLRKIGQGGMGEVWLAEDPRLQRQVALKVLPQRNRADQQFLTRFEREARAAAALHHPHILQVHDYGQQGQSGGATVAYLVMSYVSGGSVEDRLKALAKQQGALTQDEALAYLAQVAEAIDYAHAHGIIHRDIKPANMLLREDNWLLLTDFGIARILNDTDSATTTGSFLGTPTYMAPEQAQSHAVPASDIYSLAIVAYQLFTGRVPFHADNPLATTFQHAFSAPVAPRAYNPTLPLAFDVALLRGMAKDPAQRPPSATAFVTSLQQALEHGRAVNMADHAPVQVASQTEPPQTEPPQRLPQPRVGRRKLLLGVGAGAGALLVGGGVAAYTLHSLNHPNPTTLTPTAVAKSSATATNANAPLAITNAFTHEVGQMAWSPAKNVLTTFSRDSQIVLWEMPGAGQSTAPRRLAHQQIGFGSSLEDWFLSWSPDGQMLAVANAGFDLKNDSYETLLYSSDLAHTVAGVPVNFIESKQIFHGVSWISHNYLVTVNESTDYVNTSTGGRKLVLSAWNVQQPQQKPFTTTISQTLTSDLSTTINLVSVSPDGSTVAIGTSQGVLLGQLNTSSNPITWQQHSSLLSLNNQEINALAWSADGHYIAALNSVNNAVGVWDVTNKYSQVLLNLDTSHITGQLKHLTWSSNVQSPALALGGTDGQVLLLNVGGSLTVLRTLPGSIASEMTALAWSHDGQWLASSYKDIASSILLWRM